MYKAITNFIKYPFEFDTSSMVYLILNYYQALKEYQDYLDSFYINEANKLIQNINNLFDTISKCGILNDEIEGNQQLLFFWNATVPKENMKL